LSERYRAAWWRIILPEGRTPPGIPTRSKVAKHAPGTGVTPPRMAAQRPGQTGTQNQHSRSSALPHQGLADQLDNQEEPLAIIANRLSFAYAAKQGLSALRS
jgi:hypothetical protein